MTVLSEQQKEIFTSVSVATVIGYKVVTLLVALWDFFCYSGLFNVEFFKRKKYSPVLNVQFKHLNVFYWFYLPQLCLFLTC